MHDEFAIGDGKGGADQRLEASMTSDLDASLQRLVWIQRTWLPCWSTDNKYPRLKNGFMTDM